MDLNPEYEIELQPYDMHELATITDYYSSRGFLNCAPLSDLDLVKMKLRSGNVPSSVFSNAADLMDTAFVPEDPMDETLRANILTAVRLADPEGDAFDNRNNRNASDAAMEVVVEHTDVTIPQEIVPWTHDLTKEWVYEFEDDEAEIRAERVSAARHGADVQKQSSNAFEGSEGNSGDVSDDDEEETAEISPKEQYVIDTFVKDMKRSGFR